MTNGPNSNDWDDAPWSTWGADDSATGTGENDGWPSEEARATSAEIGEEETSGVGARSEGAGGEGRWVSQGGVLRWEAGEGERDVEDAQAEVKSRWAEEEIELPQGAPDTLRIRAAHAWLA